MNKIVSFSLFGDLNCYLQGALDNLKIKNDFYPDWKYRFYISSDLNPKVKDKLLESGSEVIVKQKGEGLIGLFWRFEPLDDEKVDIFISRDIDARPNNREVRLVEEWEKSNFDFHIIRDHPNHGQPICGGMWGAKKKFKPNYQKIYNNWIKLRPPVPNKKGLYHFYDQFFLKECIWPMIKDNHLAHVRNYNQLKFTGKEKIIEEPTDGFFIGRSHLKNLTIKYE